jgi:hypothetical protein
MQENSSAIEDCFFRVITGFTSLRAKVVTVNGWFPSCPVSSLARW